MSTATTRRFDAIRADKINRGDALAYGSTDTLVTIESVFVTRDHVTITTNTGETISLYHGDIVQRRR